jgi:hypothetical protein
MRSLLFLTLATLCAGQSIVVSDCSAGASEFEVLSVSFSPTVPVAGENGTLHTIYDVPVTVSEGSASYSCMLNGLPVYNEKYDLCTQTSCPITAGSHDDYSISEVPSISGKLKCTIHWQDKAGTLLLCIDTTIKFVSESGNLRGPTPDVSKFRPKFLFGTNLDTPVRGPEPAPYEPHWPALLESDSMSDSSSDSTSTSTYDRSSITDSSSTTTTSSDLLDVSDSTIYTNSTLD